MISESNYDELIALLEEMKEKTHIVELKFLTVDFDDDTITLKLPKGLCDSGEWKAGRVVCDLADVFKRKS